MITNFVDYYENYKCTYQYEDKAEACVDAYGECEICKYYKKICPIIKKECSVSISCEDCFMFNEYSEIDVNDEYVVDELMDALRCNCLDDDDVITFVNDFLEDDDEIPF